MSKNINSASRIETLLRAIPGGMDETQTLSVWENLFGVTETNPHKRSSIVGARLTALYRELELVKDQMREAGYSEHLYAPAISNIEQVISLIRLPERWAGIRPFLSAETFTALAFCGEILPDEEKGISADELASIKAQVDELQSSLANSQLPPRLRSLIEYHIQLILTAIEEYPISGAKALREAARTALGEIVEVKDELSEHGSQPAVSKLAKVWQFVNQIADAAIKTDKVVQIGTKAWAFLQNTLTPLM